MDLSPRLRAIAEQVPKGAKFADIGTDHGYLPVWLLLNGVAASAIAADLRPGPLERARQTAQRYGAAERISFRLCDGLSGIGAGEADVIAIAGMGGDTIAAILGAAPWTREPGRMLLLQPMTAQPELRLWLRTQGYVIRSERVAREGRRLYSVWTAAGGEMPPLSPGELWAGRQSADPLRGEYLDYITARADKALRGHLAAERRDEEAVARLRAVCDDLKKLKEAWEHGNFA